MSKRNVGKGIRQLASGTVASRLTGLARDVSLAGVFGPGNALAGFLLAFTVPNLLRRLLGEGALTEAAVPIFTEREHKAGRQAAFALINRLLLIATLMLVAFSLLTLAAAPTVEAMLNGTWLPEQGREFLLAKRTQIAVDLLPLIMPYCVFICLGGFIGGILNALNHFKVPAFAPVLLNLAFLAAIGWIAANQLGLDDGVKVLVWAVLIAGALQLAAVTAILKRHGWRPGFGSGNGVGRVFRQVSFLILGASLVQINVSIDRILAIWLGAGAVTGLYFAERLIYLPVGVIGVAVASAALPNLSRAAIRGDDEAASDILGYCLRVTTLATLPAAVLLGVLREPVVRLLFERGNFGPAGVAATTVAVVAYAPGIPIFAVAKPLRSAFIGRGDVKTPVAIGTFCLILNLILNLILMQHLAHAGLALATVISNAANLGILSWLLVRSNSAYATSMRSFASLILRLLPALAAAAVVSYALSLALPSGTFGDLLSILLGGLLGGTAYLVVARITAKAAFQEFTALFRRTSTS